MSKLLLHIFKFLFSALLPPKDEETNTKHDYYGLLGIKSNATAEAIKKAYRKKSLEFHPDKISQFSKAKSMKEMDADFVNIKEAYEILSNPKKRRLYDVLGVEGMTITKSHDPQSLLQNVSKANFLDKTKLLFLVLFLLGMILAGPIMICLKVNDTLKDEGGALVDTSWVLVFIPIFFFEFVFVVFMIATKIWFRVLLMSCLIVSQVLLALKWDDTIDWKYLIVLIPLYVHQFLVLVKAKLTFGKIRNNLQKMVTMDYLESYIIPNYLSQTDNNVKQDEENDVNIRTYSDLNDEEKEYINRKYIIINSPRNKIDPNTDQEDDHMLDAETKQLIAIANSVEYHELMVIRSRTLKSVLSTLIIHVPFFVLLVLKLDSNKDWNWFLVFTPILVEIGWNLCQSCCTCCCMLPSVEDDNDWDDETSQVKDLDVPNVDEDAIESTLEENFNSDKDIDIKEKSDSSSLHSKEDTGKPVPITSSLPSGDSHVENIPFTNVGEDSNVEDPIGFNPEQAEEDARDMDKRARSLGTCCYQMILVVILVLFLVKMNKSDEGKDNNDVNHSSEEGYNSFWVAFPIFFFASIILCCCCIAIYSGMEKESLTNMMSKKDGEHGENVAVPVDNKVDDIEEWEEDIPKKKCEKDIPKKICDSSDDSDYDLD